MPGLRSGVGSRRADLPWLPFGHARFVHVRTCRMVLAPDERRLSSGFARAHFRENPDGHDRLNVVFYGSMAQGQNMSGEPRRSRENALPCATRATTTRTPDLKMQLVQWAKGFLRRSIELQRNMAPWIWMDRLRSRRVTSPHRSDPTGLGHLDEANRHVAQSEQLVTGWRDVVDRLQAEGRDVTVAQDLLETFQGNLEVHRRNRDLIEQVIAETASVGPPQSGSSPAQQGPQGRGHGDRG
jgi:hypothetical protein